MFPVITNEKSIIDLGDIKLEIQKISDQIHINLIGNIVLTINGETSIFHNGNLNIDTDTWNGNKIYLNSRTSQQIKDLPESIDYRKKQKLLSDKITPIANELSTNKYDITNDDDRSKLLESFIPKEV